MYTYNRIFILLTDSRSNKYSSTIIGSKHTSHLYPTPANYHKYKQYMFYNIALESEVHSHTQLELLSYLYIVNITPPGTYLNDREDFTIPLVITSHQSLEVYS